MKKVLFATTALVASTSFAMADISLSGSAEMGVLGGEDTDLQFHTDIDVTFKLRGETDGGLEFGANIDLDEIDGEKAFAPASRDGEYMFVKGSFGSLTMGDTDGAFDWAMQEVLVAGGSLGDDEEHGGYSGNSGLDGTHDGQIARYDNSFGDFGFGVSVEIDDAGDFDPIFGIGVKYDVELGGFTLGVGVGYQSGEGLIESEVLVQTAGADTPLNPLDDVFELQEVETVEDQDIWGISLDGEFDNGLGFALNYSDSKFGGEHYGIGLGYEMDAWGFGINYGEFDGGDSGFGLAVEYDLGGGAALQFGYGDSDVAEDTYTFGLSMSF